MNFIDRKKIILGNVALIPIAALLVVALILKQLLPRQIDLLGAAVNKSTYTEPDRETVVRWLDGERNGFTCVFNRSVEGYRCGYDMRLRGGGNAGINLSNFEYIKLVIHYEGPATRFRVSFNNEYSGQTEIMAEKKHENFITLRNGRNEILMPFSELKVPQWWVDQAFQPNKDQIKPERTSVTHIGFDVETPMPIGVHVIRVERFEALNHWAYLLQPLPLVLLSVIVLLVLAILNSIPHLYQLVKRFLDWVGEKKQNVSLFEKLIGDVSSNGLDPLMLDAETGFFKKDQLLELVYRNMPVDRGVYASVLYVSFAAVEDQKINASDPMGSLLIKFGLVAKAVVDDLCFVVRWGQDEVVIIFPGRRLGIVKKLSRKIVSQIKSEVSKSIAAELKFYCGRIELSPNGGNQERIESVYKGDASKVIFSKVV